MAKEIIDIPPLDSTISLNVSLDKFPQDLLKLHPMDIDINLKLDSSKVVGNNPLKPKKSSNSTVTMKIHSENVTITKADMDVTNDGLSQWEMLRLTKRVLSGVCKILELNFNDVESPNPNQNDYRSASSRKETKPDTRPSDGDCEPPVNKPSKKTSDKVDGKLDPINVNNDHVKTQYNHITFESVNREAKAEEKNEKALSDAEVWLKIMKLSNIPEEDKPTATGGGEKSKTEGKGTSEMEVEDNGEIEGADNTTEGGEIETKEE